MSLGVLNNLSAVYAENNLNNTSNSLNTVLQQLSSGSKINSGADDAAGLSLVDGLEANQMALTQSQTNATEGVGLLQVADGALSQVTSLLNRAVTLATEASNGTLNSSQDTAANQEYQSILSEINNIGTTTTYNQEAVFNSNTNIYTGDSSTTGASIDDLNIRSLSSSNVGDSDGAMAYSSGNSGGNVFIDLSNTQNVSTATVDANVNDYLNGGSSGSTSMTINTLSSSGTVVANAVTVGGSSGYANTAAGMISAINNSGLGVTASFTTAAVAGDPTSSTTKVSATDTGIMISGSVGAGAQPSESSFSGSITDSDANSTSGADDTLTGSLTLQVGSSAATTVTMAQVATAAGVANGSVTQSDLATYLNNNAGLGVSASVNSAGVLTLASGSTADPSTQTLKVSSNLVDTSDTTAAAALSYTATAAYSAGITTGAYGSNGITDSGIDGAGKATYATTGSAAAAGSGSADGTAGLVGTITTTGTDGTLTITDTGTTAADVQGTAGQIAAGVFNNGVITLGIAGYTDTLANLETTLNTAFATDSTDGGAGEVNNDLVAAINSTGGLTISETTAGAGFHNASLATVALNTAATTAYTQSTTLSDTIAAGAASASGGIATISYTDQAGASLSGTDLSDQADAESALTTLNTAITAVAAQDGYVGAQINTLNAVSSVLSTQQENVQSAQNAVQATDYAAATSNMSKYEILSQTGISALAQANSMEQEVTKLLQ